MRRILSVLFLTLFVLVSCKNKLFDYRNKFIGNYNFVYTRTWDNTSLPGGTAGDTTIYYMGEVIPLDDNQLAIAWYDGTVQNVVVAKDGVLSVCDAQVGTVNDEMLNMSYENDLCGLATSGEQIITLTGAKQ